MKKFVFSSLVLSLLIIFGTYSNKQGAMRLPFDTTTHYIAIHVHPFAEFLELRDLTTTESVFKGIVKINAEQKFIDQITYFSNEEGIMLYRDHDYELVTQYNNNGLRHWCDGCYVSILVGQAF